MPNAFGFATYPQRPAVKAAEVGAALMRRAMLQPAADEMGDAVAPGSIPSHVAAATSAKQPPIGE